MEAFGNLEQQATRLAAGVQPAHSPNISLGHNFGASGLSLLDDTDVESSSADEEEVCTQLLQHAIMNSTANCTFCVAMALREQARASAATEQAFDTVTSLQCMQVAQQVKVIEEQLARGDVDEWERDILMSELDLLNNIRNNHTPHA